MHLYTIIATACLCAISSALQPQDFTSDMYLDADEVYEDPEVITMANASVTPRPADRDDTSTTTSSPTTTTTTTPTTETDAAPSQPTKTNPPHAPREPTPTPPTTTTTLSPRPPHGPRDAEAEETPICRPRVYNYLNWIGAVFGILTVVILVVSVFFTIFIRGAKAQSSASTMEMESRNDV